MVAHIGQDAVALLFAAETFGVGIVVRWYEFRLVLGDAIEDGRPTLFDRAELNVQRGSDLLIAEFAQRDIQ